MKGIRISGRLLWPVVFAVFVAAPSLAGQKDMSREAPTLGKVKEQSIVSGKKAKTSAYFAPELDLPAAGSAAVLLLGGTLVAFGRRRRDEPAVAHLTQISSV